MAKKEKLLISENTPYIETYVHIYHGRVQAVQVGVHVNYNDGTISIVQVDPNQPTNIQGKQFIFRNRTLDYMDGWHDILDAIKSAIDDATDRLKEHSNRKAEKLAEAVAANR